MQMTPEMAQGIRAEKLESIRSEMAATAKVIRAIPEAKKEWKPDEKAKSAFELAWHIVSADVQMLHEVADLKFTMEERFPAKPTTVEGVAAWYEAELPKALDRVAAMTVEQCLTPVDFYGMFQYPAIVYTGFVEKHSIHHRGQLSVYLRPMGSKVPSIYGGSADEPFTGA